MYIKKFRYNGLYAVWESVVRTHIALHKMSVPEQQVQCLVVFCMFGVNEKTYQMIVDKGIVPRKSIINNYKTFLKDHGLLVKIRSNVWEVCSDFKDLSVSKGIELKIKIDIADGTTK